MGSYHLRDRDVWHVAVSLRDSWIRRSLIQLRNELVDMLGGLKNIVRCLIEGSKSGKFTIRLYHY